MPTNLTTDQLLELARSMSPEEHKFFEAEYHRQRRANLPARTCPACGKSFRPTTDRQVYCVPGCQKWAASIRDLAKGPTGVRVSQIDGVLHCVGCDAPITITRGQELHDGWDRCDRCRSPFTDLMPDGDAAPARSPQIEAALARERAELARCLAIYDRLGLDDPARPAHRQNLNALAREVRRLERL